MDGCHTDVIIAGVAAAPHPAQGGLRVLLLEAPPTVAMDSRDSNYPRRLGLSEILHAMGLCAPGDCYTDRLGGGQIRFDMSKLADIIDHLYRLQCDQWKRTRLGCAHLNKPFRGFGMNAAVGHEQEIA